MVHTVLYEVISVPGQFGNRFDYYDTIIGDIDKIYSFLLSLKPGKLVVNGEYKVRCGNGEFMKSDLIIILLGAKEAGKQFGYDEKKCERKLERMKIKSHNL